MRGIALETPIFFCAAEPSGDLYASFFIKKLKDDLPQATVIGVGGERMREAGADIIIEYRKLMAFGLHESLLSARRNFSVYRKVARRLRIPEFQTFVAVAYPGMNLLLCRKAKQRGMKVYYLLPPQIWAWGTFRKYFIKKWVDVVLSLFPFEHTFYRQHGIKTLLLVNPLVHELQRYERNDHKERIGFMPGSRISQIRRNLPTVRQLIRKIKAHRSELEYCMILHDRTMAGALLGLDAEVDMIWEDQYQAMKNCDLLITSSGTASLEACLLGVPQIFFNRPSLLDFYVLRRLLRIKEYNLCNIYHGRAVVPTSIHCNQQRLVDDVFSEIDLSRFACR